MSFPTTSTSIKSSPLMFPPEAEESEVTSSSSATDPLMLESEPEPLSMEYPIADPYPYDVKEVDEVDETDYGYGYGYGNGNGNGLPELAERVASPSSSSLLSPFPKTTRRRSSLKSAASAKHRMLRRRASLSYKGEEIQVRLADKTIVRRALSIGFADEKNQIREVEPYKDTPHKDDLWFNAEEEDSFRDKASFVVEYARQIGPDETERKQIPTRGLEPYIYNEEFAEKRKLAVAAVLEEQYEQRCRGEYNEQGIGQAYTNQSSYCQEMAQIQADLDYSQVKKDHQQTRRSMLMMQRRSSC